MTGAFPSRISEDTLCGVYIDMGTTNTRVWLIRGLEVLASNRMKIGIADSAREGSRRKISDGLKQLIAGLRAEQGGRPARQPAFCIAAGMITSSLGLVEIPHLLAPAGETELAAALQLHRFPDIADLPFLLVPGVRWNAPRDIHAPMMADLMRGEETLCVGLLRKGILKPNATLLSLGSHWKVIGIDGGCRIASCVTSLSGELLQAAQTQTILASAVPQIWPEQFDSRWVEAGMREESKSGLARALFCVRLLQQTGKARPGECFAFLCGAFIGADLRALLSRQALRPDSRVVIAGSQPLAPAWQHALVQNGIRSTLLKNDEAERALLTGLHGFAQAACPREIQLLRPPPEN